MPSNVYRSNVVDIDDAIASFVTQKRTAAANTKFLVRHSRKPRLVAPVKAVMWPGIVGDKRADGGEAREALEALNYTGESLTKDALEEEPTLRTSLSAMGLSAAPERLFLYRYVHGRDLSRALQAYVDAEQRLRDVLGRPHERRDVLRATAELLYCKLFGGSLCKDPNHYGFDVHRTRSPKRVQVKAARKAESNNAGIAIHRSHLEGSGAFDVLALFWFGAGTKVEDFVCVSLQELQKLAGARKARYAFDLKPENVDAATRAKSLRRFAAAAAEQGLQEFDDTSAALQRVTRG